MTDHTPTTAGKAETLEHTPTPWRIEEDWTAEIVGADGTLIGKIVYPSNINDARFLIEAVNSHAANLMRITELEAEVKALREALKPLAAWDVWNNRPTQDDIDRARSLIPESNDGDEG